MDSVNNKNRYTGLEVAVIGLACRFPEAKNKHQFWENIKEGKECISFVSRDEFKQFNMHDDLFDHPNYVNSKGGVLKNQEMFDCDFFSYIPFEAELMDPQVRLLHEVVWEAIEDSGYVPEKYHGKIGLYAGASDSFYWKALSSINGNNDKVGVYSGILNNKDFIATSIGYKLNLNGPCVSVQTACSTSMVAIHTAYRAVLTGECDIALAGGANVWYDDQGYMYQDGMINSSDGHCRAFDKDASGTIPGSGAGIVVLKSLDQAIKDGDNIYAIIKGSAINNDGSRKAGFTAPSIKGQSEVIRSAIKFSQIDIDSISYVETHGTGTPLGDLIEIKSLNKAFGNRELSKKCPIGSVKTNIGHLDAAAGVAGFIKTVLSVKNKQVPASINFKVPNPKIDFENGIFYVNTKLKPWETINGYPIRAGVSSFGVGGTNAHIILEEAPSVNANNPVKEDYQLLISAKTEKALDNSCQNILSYIQANPNANLANIEHTLKTGRKNFEFRRTIRCGNISELTELLSTPDSRKINTYHSNSEVLNIVFVFPGIGSQYKSMGLDLYKNNEIFKKEVDQCIDILSNYSSLNIKSILFSSENSDLSEDINEFGNSQISNFIIDYALGQLLLQIGIKPSGLFGYSFGEYAAACIAGVISLEDTLKLLLFRNKLVNRIPKGKMLSVPLSKDDVQEYLNDNIYLSIDNGASCIVSGTISEMKEFENLMRQNRYLCVPVESASYPIHSELMSEIRDEFAEFVSNFKLGSPSIPIVSGITGDWVSDTKLCDPNYWGDHLCETVNFSKGIENILNQGETIFIEVGPGNSITSMLSRYTQERGTCKAVSILPNKANKKPDNSFLNQKLGQLWLYGLDLNWAKLESKNNYRKISLPTYPFEQKSFWFDEEIIDQGRKMYSNIKSYNVGNDLGDSQDNKLTNTIDYFNKQKNDSDFNNVLNEIKNDQSLIGRKPNASDWFYTMNWKRSVNSINLPIAGETKVYKYLVFIDDIGIGERLVKDIEKKDDRIIVVKKGPEFIETSSNEFTINPKKYENYNSLIQRLQELNNIPDRIIHLWNIGKIGGNLNDIKSFIHEGFYSILNIAKAIAYEGITSKINLEIVSNDLHHVTGGEDICPEKSLLLGPAKIIPFEIKSLKSRNLDLSIDEDTNINEININNLLSDIVTENLIDQKIIAYRGNYRWLQIVDNEPINENIVNVRFKEKGTYLITGGFGAMGYEIAKYLAAEFSAKLILIGRSHFPERHKWNEYLESDSKDDKKCSIIKELSQLEKNGAEFLTYSADISDYDQMQTVIKECESKIGKIEGLLHTAGLMDPYGMLANRTNEQTDEILVPKVYGTIVLDRLLPDLDFMILFSTMGTICYGEKFGQIAYNAANEFLDSYTYYKANGKTNTLTINWNDWIGTGMSDRARRMKYDTDTPFEFSVGVSPDEGVKIFNMIANSNYKHIMISPVDLDIMMRIFNSPKYQEISFQYMESLSAGKKDSDKHHEKPMLCSEYVAPKNEIQEKIVNIFQDFFKYDKIGIDDDFFELGGDSLKATILVSKINKELEVNIPIVTFFKNSTVSKLFNIVSKQSNKEQQIVQHTEKKEYYTTSFPQKRLYILQQIEKSNIGYSEVVVLKLKGNLDINKLENAFNKLIERHEVFRSSLLMIEGNVVQKVEEVDKLKISVESDYGSDFKKIIEEFVSPFDLRKPPFIKVKLLKETENQYYLLINLHHVIADLMSRWIFENELMALYDEDNLPRLGIQYKDYSEWQNLKIQKTRNEKQKTYWLDKFNTMPPIVQLPTDFTRPKTFTFEGEVVDYTINVELVKRIDSFVKNNEITTFMFLLSVINVLIAKLGNQEDIVIGSPIAGRNHADLHNLIGVFINTLAFRNNPKGEKTYMQFLSEIKENTIGAFENQEFQYEELIDNLMTTRDISRNPLFDIMFSYQTEDESNIDSENTDRDFTISTTEHENITSKVDISFICIKKEDTIQFKIEYYTRIYKRETIERFVKYLTNIIEFVLDKPDSLVSDIEYMPDSEVGLLLNEFNKTKLDYDKSKTIPDLFREKANEYPHRIAMQFKDNQITYSELDSRSNQLANKLLKSGVEPNSIVGFMVDRSPEMMIGLLGILKSGSAYLPIDPSFPANRISYMLENGKVKILLTERKLEYIYSKFKHNFNILDVYDSYNYSKEISIDTPKIKPDNLGYVIYTSGSTGNPKGVMIEHKSINNLIESIPAIIPYGPQKSIMAMTTISFDIFITETLLPIIKGGRVHIMDSENVRDPNFILSEISKYCIDIMQVTPSRMKLILEGKNSLSVICRISELLITGEQFPKNLLNQLSTLTKTRVFNMYGPTETTVWSLARELTGKEDVDIGKPIGNTQIYILDKDNKLTSKGAIGELCIAGDGLARGYWNDELTTSQKFITNPLKKSGIIYKTGDLARWLPDGNIECLGRIDHQVKIRGYRIELEEIEKVLSKFKDIKEVVLKVNENKNEEKLIIAYYTSDNSINGEEMENYLKSILPSYMIPTYYIQLDKFPCTPNGKIDKNKLPDYKANITEEVILPENDIEELLQKIWSEVLDIDVNLIGINSNFFSFGGNSLNLIKVANKINEELNMELSTIELFNYTTIRSLSAFLMKQSEEINDNSHVYEEELELFTNITSEFQEDL